jgi:hypothetical protein
MLVLTASLIFLLAFEVANSVTDGWVDRISRRSVDREAFCRSAAASLTANAGEQLPIRGMGCAGPRRCHSGRRSVRRTLAAARSGGLRRSDRAGGNFRDLADIKQDRDRAMADRRHASKGLDHVEGHATMVRFERKARMRLPRHSLPGGELSCLSDRRRLPMCVIFCCAPIRCNNARPSIACVATQSVVCLP